MLACAFSIHFLLCISSILFLSCWYFNIRVQFYFCLNILFYKIDLVRFFYTRGFVAHFEIIGMSSNWCRELLSTVIAFTLTFSSIQQKQSVLLIDKDSERTHENAVIIFVPLVVSTKLSISIEHFKYIHSTFSDKGALL